MPRRRRPGHRIAGIPVSVVVALELVGFAALLGAKQRTGAVIAGAVIAAVVVFGFLVRRHGIRLGPWLALRTGYLMRQRVLLVAATQFDDPSRDDRGIDTIDLPPELHAFFPGVTVWQTRTHEGDQLGVIEWRGTCSATLELRQPGGILRRRDQVLVPLDKIVDAVFARDLAVDAVQVVTHTIVGEQDAGQAQLLGVAAAELQSTQPRVRNRSCYVTVRVDPATAGAAITARGGGQAGIGRLLSAALSAVRAAVVEAGLDARPLDGVSAGRAIADTLYHPATSYDPIIRWKESVRDISSTRMAHGSFTVTDVRRRALADIPAGNVFAYSIGTQVRRDGDGYATNTVVRLSCRSRARLRDASRTLRHEARRLGVGLRPADAMQHVGLRATVTMGGA